MPIPITRPSEVVLQLISIYQGVDDVGPPLALLWSAMAFPLQSLPESMFPSYRLRGIDPEVVHPEFLADIRELMEELLIKVNDGRVSLTSVGRVLTVVREMPDTLHLMAENMDIIRGEVADYDMKIGAYTDTHGQMTKEETEALTVSTLVIHLLGSCKGCQAAYRSRLQKWNEGEKRRIAH